MVIDAQIRDEDHDEMVTDVISAIQEGNIDAVKNAISGCHLPVDSVDRDGCSLLHWAAINNRSVAVSLLIANGVNVNYLGGLLGENALMWVSRR